MWLQHFRIAIRTLWKNKVYGLLNMAGLAIGITCAALIFLWVENECTYNHNFSKRNTLYRIMQHQTYEGKVSTFQADPGLMAAAVKAEIPGIRNACRTSLDKNFKLLFSNGDKAIEEQGQYADSSLFSMLELPFVYGTPGTAFTELHSVVISESMSHRFFGDGDPVGKTLKVDDGQAYTVSGVFGDLPANSSFQFQWLIPFGVYAEQNDWLKYWQANGAATYVELEPSADVVAINRQLKGYLGTKVKGWGVECYLTSMNDWNLAGYIEGGKQIDGKIRYVRLFSLIACIILLIACINFMNLATARSEQRAKEVGMRKAMGARKGKLIVQFIGESLILSYASVVLSIALLYLTLPYFNQLVREELSLDLLAPLHVGALFGIGALTGLVAGSYPAFYLSSFNPVTIFKGMRLKTSLSNLFVRKGLVVAQFSVSILLIISTVIIYQQIRYILSRDMGYAKDNVITLQLRGDAVHKTVAIQDELMRTGVVKSAALSEYPVLQIWNNTDNIKWQGKDIRSDVLITYEGVSPGYIRTMDMKIKAGRDFYGVPGADTNNVIINEAMALRMGKEGRVGALVTDDNGQSVRVIGIVGDFVFNNMYQGAEALMLYCRSAGVNYLNIRLNAGPDLSEALNKVGGVMKQFSPAYPFEYHFLDEEYATQFKTETLIGKLAALFALLAVFISCLGLFGLAAYATERRTKEIGIRKVLGASVAGLTGLLSKDFLQLVGVACVIAFPAAWWAMNAWLQDYDYHTEIHWWVFALAGAGAIGIALATVSYQSIRAALANPVKSLRTE